MSDQRDLFAEQKAGPLGPQAQMVLDHLRRGESLTALDALRLYGVGRLAAVVFDLKCAGFDIESDRVTVDKAKGRGKSAVASYRLVRGGRAPLSFGDPS